MDTVAPEEKSLLSEADLRCLVDTLVGWDQSGEVGKICALRTWWHPSKQHIAFPVMGALVGQHINNPLWTAIPALFALHTLNTEDKSFNLGVTCRRLAGTRREALVPWFRRILACDEGSDLEEIIDGLRWLAPRAREKCVPINYFRLGIDLSLWQSCQQNARELKLAWTREYFWINSDEGSTTALPL